MKRGQNNDSPTYGDLAAKVNNLTAELEAHKRWREQQEKKEKKKRNEKIAGAVIGGIAPIAAGAGFYHFLGNQARNLGEAFGEGYEALKVAARILKPNSRTNEVQNYLARIDPNVGNGYLQHRDEGYLKKIETAVVESLEASNRASEKVPGAQTKPVEGLRGIRGWIMEQTSVGRDKEETQIRNTQPYQVNYNEVAKIRLNAISRLRGLNGEVEELCWRMAVNEAKNKEIKGSDLKLLENMAGQYNSILQIAEGKNQLEVKQIQEGTNDAGYKALIGQAQEYNLQTSDFSGYGTGALIIGTVAAAYLGNRIAKPLTLLGKGTYKGAIALKDLSLKSIDALRKARNRKG